MAKSNECHIGVVGVGKDGNNIIDRLIEMGVTATECFAVGTDAVQLRASKASHKILIDRKLVEGFDVESGRRSNASALDESRRNIENVFSTIDIAFVTGDLSHKTTAAVACAVAGAAKRKGAITVGVVTATSVNRLGRKQSVANALTQMRQQCHTVVVVDNKRLSQLVPKLPRLAAHRVASQVLAKMIKGVVETISNPDLIDFGAGDFKRIFRRSPLAVVGVDDSNISSTAVETVQNAMRISWFDLEHAEGTDSSTHMADDTRIKIEKANRVGEIATGLIDDNALSIWGARLNPQFADNLNITLLMAGVESPHVPTGLGQIAPHLFNLEQCSEPERPIPLKLDLYEMEHL